MIGTAEQNFRNIKLDDKAILKQCFKIATEFCRAGDREDIVKEYSEIFYKEYDQIENFINNVLIPESDTVPCLVKNRK